MVVKLSISPNPSTIHSLGIDDTTLVERTDIGRLAQSSWTPLSQKCWRLPILRQAVPLLDFIMVSRLNHLLFPQQASSIDQQLDTFRINGNW